MIYKFESQQYILKWWNITPSQLFILLNTGGSKYLIYNTYGFNRIHLPSLSVCN